MDYFYSIAGVLLLWFLAILSPGPNFALVTRVAITQSRAAGVAVSFGVAISATIYAILTLIGLAKIFGENIWLTIVVQLLGGFYLIYLGVSSWLSSRQLQKASSHHEVVVSDHPNSPAFPISTTMPLPRAFFSGLLVGLSNPKELTFFVSIFALLVPVDLPLWMKITLVASGFLMEAVWYAVVAVLFSTARSREVYQRFGIWIDGVFGVLLTLLGLRLLWQVRLSLQNV